MSEEAVKNNMISRHEGYQANLEVLLAMLPLAVMSVFMYGVRTLVMLAVAFVTAIVCDRLAAIARHQKYDATEISSLVIAGMITFLMPAAVDYYIIMVAVSAGVLIGKHLFGGYDSYPFNPAALGYAIAVVSWPDKIFQYTTPFVHVNVFNAAKTASYTSSAASAMHLGGLPSISLKNMLIGNIAGGIGTTAALVLLSCYVFLIIRKRASIITPVVFTAVCAFTAFVFPRVQASRVEVVKYELLSGTLIYGAVFLLSDKTTLPKNKISKLVYGVVLGIVTLLFRYYGTYESGICFAILFVNSISGYLDRVVSKLSGKYIVYKQNKKLNISQKNENNENSAEKNGEKSADKPAEQPEITEKRPEEKSVQNKEEIKNEPDGRKKEKPEKEAEKNLPENKADYSGGNGKNEKPAIDSGEKKKTGSDKTAAEKAGTKKQPAAANGKGKKASGGNSRKGKKK